MSTRSRSSFRSLHSNPFRSVSPAPSQPLPSTTSPKPSTSTEKTRHAKREKFKEAIEQFFDKLHHHHRSEFGHATHDARSSASDSHSAAKTVSPASSRDPSIKHVKTDISLVPYDLAGEASFQDQAEEVIEIKNDYAPLPITRATSAERELAQDPPAWDRHIRVSTETSVEVVIPVNEDPGCELESQPEIIVAMPVNTSNSLPTPPSIPTPACSHAEEMTPVAAPPVTSSPEEISVPSFPPLSPPVIATSLGSSSWYIDFPTMIPHFQELRQLVDRRRRRADAVQPEKPSTRLLSFLFDNIFTRMAGFAFDMWLLSICFFLVKVLRVRPRVLRKVESWIP